MSGPNLTSMAWRNLWRHRRRTLLTLSSIAFGTTTSLLPDASTSSMSTRRSMLRAATSAS